MVALHIIFRMRAVTAMIWARDPEQSKAHRHLRPIEQKASFRWLSGYRHLLALQAELPDTQLVNVTDREGEIYELFAARQAAATNSDPG